MKSQPEKFEKVVLSIWFVTYTALVVAFETATPEHIDFETKTFYVAETDDSNPEVESLFESKRGPRQLEELAASGVPSLEELIKDELKIDEKLRHAADDQMATKAGPPQAEVKNLVENLPAGSPTPPALPAPNNARVQTQ